MLDRPSQEKVVGVSNRYIAHKEALAIHATERFRMRNEELTLLEAQAIGYTVGIGYVRQLVGMPVQALRRRVLWEAQKAEGLKPGEQDIAKFALRMCDSPEKYPKTTQALSSKPIDD